MPRLTRTESKGLTLHRHGPGLLVSAQVRTRLTPSKQARETLRYLGAMTTHNFSPNPLAYDYESDYADYSDDYYYEYEHMQEVRV